jgi:sec-independent protein translocase protein TatA
MEIILVLVIALLVLGPKKLPEVGRSVGKGLREFKDGVSGLTGGDDDEPETAKVVRSSASTSTPTPEPDPEPAVTGAASETTSTRS